MVDNDSREDTREVFSFFGDRIVALPQSENLGYAEGMNVGIRHAIAAGAQFVVLLNQDTEVDPDWLTHLLAAAESDARVGAVQPRVMLGGAHDVVNSIGNHIHVLGFGYAGGHRERWSDLRRRLRGFPYPEVTYCSGAAVMFRVAALRDVATREGEFLERDFFMYHEDLDLGVRLWMRGYRCVLAPQSVVTHYYEFSRSIAKLYWMERNRLLFLYENFRWGTLLLLAPLLIASELGLLFFAFRGGWLSQKLRACRALVAPRNWGAFRAQRRAKQAKRRLPDRAIVHRFTTRLTNQEVESAFVTRVVDPFVTAWWSIVRPFIRW